jgi:hypothetical protein
MMAEEITALRGKDDPLFEQVNALWKRSSKFSSAVTDRARKKYKNNFNMPKLIDTAIEIYEEASTTTVLQTYEA